MMIVILVKMGRPVVDYILSLNAAKEIALVERNAQGKRIRKYFIDCELKLHEAHQSAIDPDRKQSLKRVSEFRTEKESNYLINRATRERILYLTIQKRDAIKSTVPETDQEILWDITLDAYHAMTSSLGKTLSFEYFEYMNDEEVIECINHWKPNKAKMIEID